MLPGYKDIKEGIIMTTVNAYWIQGYNGSIDKTTVDAFWIQG